MPVHRIQQRQIPLEVLWRSAAVLVFEALQNMGVSHHLDFFLNF
jgi:hypothetical protein